jgi:hypothetical protein
MRGNRRSASSLDSGSCAAVPPHLTFGKNHQITTHEIMKPQRLRTLTGGIFAAILSMQSLSAVTIVSVPEGAWSYSTLSTIVGGMNYYPTLESEFSSASFVNYVTYGYPANGWFAQQGSVAGGFHVFTTWVTSNQNQTISFVNGGDDGHSVFIDGNFLGGAGFGVNVTGDISFAAGVPRRLTVVTHNSGGEWHANFFPNPSGDRVLEDTPGISISAIPEPTSFMLLLLFAPVLASRSRALRLKRSL